jgi:hypothetical protein
MVGGSLRVLRLLPPIKMVLFKKKKGCTRLAAASDKAYQLLTNGRWFSPGTPASSTTKTGRHDIAEILLPTNDLLIPDSNSKSVTCFVSVQVSYTHERQCYFRANSINLFRTGRVINNIVDFLLLFVAFILFLVF